MNFALPEDALLRIAAQINCTGKFHHTVRAPYNRQQVAFTLEVERGNFRTAAKVVMGGQTHSITVANNDDKRHLLVADLIDAIANGRVDSAEPAPPRVTCQPLVPEPDELLTTDQTGRIKYMVRHGGFASLDTGLANPINVAVHRTQTAQGITAIVSTGAAKPRTACFTVRGNDSDCLKRLLISIEHAHITATPQRAAAA